MAPQSAKAIKVFCSYARDDGDLRKKIETHLGFLKRENKIEHWYDGEIKAGEEWRGKIDAQLNSADVILLLISAYFVDSEFCYSVEMQRAMERHDAGEAIVIPILLHPCDWQHASFGKLHALPKGKAVSLWSNIEEALSEVAKGVREVVEGLITAQAASQTPPPVTEEARHPPTYYIPDYLVVDFVPRSYRDGNNILESLKAELAPHKKRLIALWGAGGVGKTAIAAEAARALADTFMQRVVWVSADGRKDFSLATLLDGIATQLGHDELRRLALEPKGEQVRDVVMAAPTLIVLDNFETITPEEGSICATWLAQPGLCSALITTRERIETARNVPIDPMLSEEAHTLLRRLIAQVHDPKAFENLDSERVIQTAESNPLVLQWIVGQIDLAQSADEVLNDLKHGEGPAAERVFNRSFELKQLDHGGRAVLLALSLFVPSATRRALAEVAGFGKEKDKKRFKEAVKTLSSLWLLRTAEAGERLITEGLTRELANARLSTDKFANTYRQRFVGRFLKLAKANATGTVSDLNALEMEKDNLLKAIDIALELKQWKSALEFAKGLAHPEYGMLSVRGYLDEAIRCAEQAIIAAQGDELAVASWILNTGTLRSIRNEYNEARRLHKVALVTFKKLDVRIDAAITLTMLGVDAHEIGDFSEARQYYNESIVLHEKNKNQLGLAGTLHNLGLLSEHEGDLVNARHLYYKSLKLMGKFGEQRDMAATLHQLGVISTAEGKFHEAENLLNQSLDIFVKLKHKMRVAECQESIGNLRVAEGRFSEAESLFAEVLETAQTLSDQLRIGSVKHSLGLLAEKQNNKAEATQLFRESLKIFEKLSSFKAKIVLQDLRRVEENSS